MLRKEEQDKVYDAYQKTLASLKTPQSFLHPRTCEFNRMYVFAPENLSESIRKLNVKNKNILTMTESGDPLLNLVLLGATKIDNFDSNKNAYYISCLKLAALQVLEYEEFLLFFTDGRKKLNSHSLLKGENPFVFDYKVYLSIRPNLPEEVALYWDYLYEEYQFNGSLLRNSLILYGITRRKAIMNHAYLKTRKRYDSVREKIKTVDFHFYFCDLFQIHALSNQYDVVLLWNMDLMKQENYLEKVVTELSTILKEDALVALEYPRIENNQIEISHLKKLFLKAYLVHKTNFYQNQKVIFPVIIKEYQEEKEKNCLYVFESEKM